MENNLTIVRLNRVDALTLFGMCLSTTAGALIIKGYDAYAMGLLFMSMLADAFDGILARKYGLTRDFGRYLDGFVDVFDYLVVPSLFLYTWGFNTWYYAAVLVIFMMSGIVRLSVFNEIGNIGEGDGLSYLGMPVFWSVLFLGVIYILSWIIGKAVLYPLVAVLFLAFSGCMVLNRPFYKFKNPKTIFMFVAGCAVLFFLKGLISSGDVHAGPHILTALYIIFPVIVGGSLHMLAVKNDWLPFLKIPVRTTWFGENKTLRGFVLMPVFTILGALVFNPLMKSWVLSADLTRIHPVVFGLVVGLAYVLAELPNSFIKRRMGAKPGELPEQHQTAFMLMDQLDSAFGAAIAVVVCFRVPVVSALTLLILAPGIALGVKRVLYMLKLKKSYA